MTDDQYLPNQDIDPLVIQKLGQAIIAWSLVEAFVSQLFICMTKGDRGAMYVVTGNVSAKTLTGWIRTLINSAPDDPLDEEALTLLDEIDELRVERNLYAHGVWRPGAHFGSGIISSLRLERSAILEDTVVTAADLEEFSDQAMILTKKLNSFLVRFGRGIMEGG